jgi:protein involved in sex pheromone biosynthesis
MKYLTLILLCCLLFLVGCNSAFTDCKISCSQDKYQCKIYTDYNKDTGYYDFSYYCMNGTTQPLTEEQVKSLCYEECR